MKNMETNLKAVVRYDGTEFAGWQVQPGRRTVQGALEEALSRIASHPVPIAGAGRTDAGVHALAQVFSFQWTDTIDPATLRRSLSSMLGPSIRVESMEHVAADFHARKSAIAKTYAYTINGARHPDPFSARYSWCIPWKLERGYVESLAQRLVGEHDFAGFQAGGASTKTTVRTMYSISLVNGGVVGPVDATTLWRLEFYGNGFLYKMLRNITGTLIDVARGNIPESCVTERLHAAGPYHGYTAPAQGLTLVSVEYPGENQKE